MNFCLKVSRSNSIVSFKNFNCIWTKEKGRIGRRLTQCKHDLKVLRANDNSWHFYRRWKSLLSWNAFFSDFTMSLLVLLFAFSFPLYSFQEETPDLLQRANVKFRAMFPRHINRDSCNEINVETQRDIESLSNRLKITKSECAWLRLFPRQICARICKRQMQRRFMVYASAKRIRGNLAEPKMKMVARRGRKIAADASTTCWECSWLEIACVMKKARRRTCKVQKCFCSI